MSAREDEFPLFGLIDAVRASDQTIRARVEERRRSIQSRTGLEDRALADALAYELIEDARLRSALVGAGAALPFTIPVLGFWGTMFVTIAAAALWQLAIEVELVYALAYAYGVRMDPERLRLVAFWVVHLTNFDDLRERALTIGVRLTVRKLVEKLLSVGLARAFEATAQSVMMARMMGRIPVEPWYVSATKYLGVPLLFYFGWQSTGGVGDRARAYFSETSPG